MERHKLINKVEEYLQMNETINLKSFLHISKKEQKSKREQRLADPEKKMEYTANDAAEEKSVMTM